MTQTGFWLACCVCWLVLADSSSAQEPESPTSRAQLIDEISKHVEEHFFDKNFDVEAWRGKVSQMRADAVAAPSDHAFDQQVNQLLAQLNASHTYFYSRRNPKHYQLLGVFHPLFDQNDKTLFCYEGIGIDTRIQNNIPTIISVYDGLPGDQAGLKFGDQIVSVDGKPFQPIESFAGKAGQTALLRIKRGNDSFDQEVSVQSLDGRTMFEDAMRNSIEVIEQQGHRLGYIHAWSYAGQVYQDILEESVLWGELSQCDALVLDMRDGWGGANLNYLQLFREPIATVRAEPREGPASQLSGVWQKPVALVVNSRSTSGKEMLTYGFKKLKLGPVVGSRTAGAVLGGRVFRLSTGDVLYLAVTDVSVDGIRIEGVGVEPTVPVARPLAAMREAPLDPQKAAALEVLLEKLDKN